MANQSSSMFQDLSAISNTTAADASTSAISPTAAATTMTTNSHVAAGMNQADPTPSSISFNVTGTTIPLDEEHSSLTLPSTSQISAANNSAQLTAASSSSLPSSSVEVNPKIKTSPAGGAGSPSTSASTPSTAATTSSGGSSVKKSVKFQPSGEGTTEERLRSQSSEGITSSAAGNITQLSSSMPPYYLAPTNQRGGSLEHSSPRPSSSIANNTTTHHHQSSQQHSSRFGTPPSHLFQRSSTLHTSGSNPFRSSSSSHSSMAGAGIAREHLPCFDECFAGFDATKLNPFSENYTAPSPTPWKGGGSNNLLSPQQGGTFYSPNNNLNNNAPQQQQQYVSSSSRMAMHQLAPSSTSSPLNMLHATPKQRASIHQDQVPHSLTKEGDGAFTHHMGDFFYNSLELSLDGSHHPDISTPPRPIEATPFTTESSNRRGAVETPGESGLDYPSNLPSSVKKYNSVERHPPAISSGQKVEYGMNYPQQYFSPGQAGLPPFGTSKGVAASQQHMMQEMFQRSMQEAAEEKSRQQHGRHFPHQDTTTAAAEEINATKEFFTAENHPHLPKASSFPFHHYQAWGGTTTSTTQEQLPIDYFYTYLREDLRQHGEQRRGNWSDENRDDTHTMDFIFGTGVGDFSYHSPSVSPYLTYCSTVYYTSEFRREINRQSISLAGSGGNYLHPYLFGSSGEASFVY